jgi:hypothetical protein
MCRAGYSDRKPQGVLYPGEDLSDPVAARSIVVASWSDTGIINDFGKLVIPLKNTTQHQNQALNTDDSPTGAKTLVKQMHTVIPAVLSEMRNYMAWSVQAADNATLCR